MLYEYDPCTVTIEAHLKPCVRLKIDNWIKRLLIKYRWSACILADKGYTTLNQSAI